MGSLELAFKNIEELIEDDDKIVTIPYLALTLNISIQTSQNLVKQYVENKCKTKSHGMTVTYVMKGFLKNYKRNGIFIVEDSNLEVKRDLFEKVDDELIFSIQKNKNIDFSIISLVDKIDSARRNGPLQGSIVGNHCLRREKPKKPPVPPVFKTSLEHSISVSQSAEKKMEFFSKTEPDGVTADLINKTVAPLVQKDTLYNKSTVRENKHKKGNNGIFDFFKTVSSKNASDSKSLDQKLECSFETEDNFKVIESGEGDGIQDSTSSIEVYDETEESEANQRMFAAKSKVMEKKSYKRGRDENVHKNTKRRRRIVERNDSESDDMFEKIADEDVDKSDDEPELVSSPVVKNSSEPKTRKRKAVDKTYQDSEGFIVTKTEYSYETASEEENEITLKNTVEKPVIKSLDEKQTACTENLILARKFSKEKKEKKNNKQNQPTLMNFFKKK